jgi:hypothetical protein
MPYNIAGLVIDDHELPVTGAEVRFLGPPQAVTTTTDASGAFQATIQLRARGSETVVRKPGYDASSIDASANPGNLPNFQNVVRLYPITRIAVGEVTTLPLMDGAYCGGSEFEYVCRLIRMLVPSAGCSMTICGGGSHPLRSTRRWRQTSVPIESETDGVVDSAAHARDAVRGGFHDLSTMAHRPDDRCLDAFEPGAAGARV